MPALTRRAMLAAAATGLTGAGGARLRFLVSGAAGSASDVEARAFAAFMERHLPQLQLTVVNLPGQHGLAAYQALAQAAPDGMTLGWAATPGLPARSIDSACPELMSKITLVGAVQREPVALVAPTGGANVTSARDGIDLFHRAVAAGDPIGTPPAGGPSHLAALRLGELMGARLNLVVFPSPGAVRQAVLDGNVEAATLALGEAIGSLREGKLIGLGIADDHPASVLPQIPTLQANGIALVASIVRGIAAPVGLPANLVDRLLMALQAVIADPEFQMQAEADGFDAIWLDGPQWRERTRLEHAELTQLWHRSPWTRERTG